jgi:hypothetical protein
MHGIDVPSADTSIRLTRLSIVDQDDCMLLTRQPSVSFSCKPATCPDDRMSVQPAEKKLLVINTTIRVTVFLKLVLESIVNCTTLNMSPLHHLASLLDLALDRGKCNRNWQWAKIDGPALAPLGVGRSIGVYECPSSARMLCCSGAERKDVGSIIIEAK